MSTRPSAATGAGSGRLDQHLDDRRHQSSIAEEVLDLTSGFEALLGEAQGD